MDIVDDLRELNSMHTPKEVSSIGERAADEIERLREDLDLVNQIGRIEIDAKLRYAAALRTIANNEVAEHADIDMIRDFANKALECDYSSVVRIFAK
jgi:transcriptional regulator